MNTIDIIIDIIKKIKPSLPNDYLTYLDAPLTGDIWKFQATDLTYLVLELMDFFQIRFTGTDFENYKMNSILSISTIIEQKVFQKKDMQNDNCNY